MKIKIFLLLILSLCLNLSAQTSGDESLQKLLEGNARFNSGKSMNCNSNQERLDELSNGQKPFAVILTCADSRVSPEIVYDAGLGDLFVIRIIGNIADQSSIASIQYAVEHLGSRLLVVMGHEKCGAVTAAFETHQHSEEINGVLAEIKPAIENVKSTAGDLIKNAVIENAKMVVEKLNHNPLLKKLIEENKLKTTAAYYHLTNGKVELIN